jgi:hypothetical protein
MIDRPTRQHPTRGLQTRVVLCPTHGVLGQDGELMSDLRATCEAIGCSHASYAVRLFWLSTGQLYGAYTAQDGRAHQVEV